jgi:hypothetical protein
MRLTRRGRVALVAVVAVLAFLAVAVGQAALGAFEAAAGSDASSSETARTWVVQPGETLWSIAQRVAPDSDPRDTVARIVAMNDFSGSSVVAGEQIYVPA